MFQRKQSSGTICLVASSPTEFSEDFASLLEWEVFSKSTSRLQFNRTNTFLRPRLASRDHYGRTSATTNFLALKSFELENSNIRNLDLRCLDLGGPFFSLSVPLSACPSLCQFFAPLGTDWAWARHQKKNRDVTLAFQNFNGFYIQPWKSFLGWDTAWKDLAPVAWVRISAWLRGIITNM